MERNPQLTVNSYFLLYEAVQSGDIYLDLSAIIYILAKRWEKLHIKLTNTKPTEDVLLSLSKTVIAFPKNRRIQELTNAVTIMENRIKDIKGKLRSLKK